MLCVKKKKTNKKNKKFLKKPKDEGHLGGSAVEHLPLAQGLIPDSQIESHIGLLAWSLLLHPLPVSLSLMNK